MKYCGTAGKPGGNRENKPRPKTTGASSLLEAAPLREGRLALRWGGWVRSYAAHASITLALEIYDARDGGLWGTLTAAPVTAAEWTRVEQRTRIPPGASAVRLTVTTALEALGTGAFVDELFLLPEDAPAE